MSTQETTTEQETHRKYAVDLFNLTWDLLDKTERSADENDTPPAC